MEAITSLSRLLARKHDGFNHLTISYKCPFQHVLHSNKRRAQPPCTRIFLKLIAKLLRDSDECREVLNEQSGNSGIHCSLAHKSGKLIQVTLLGSTNRKTLV